MLTSRLPDHCSFTSSIKKDDINELKSGLKIKLGKPQDNKLDVKKASV